MLTPQDIRQLRQALGLNTTAFAMLFGVTENAVRRWEIGDRHPRYDTMARMNELAREKGVSLGAAAS